MIRKNCTSVTYSFVSFMLAISPLSVSPKLQGIASDNPCDIVCFSRFDGGAPTILTLKDSNVLDQTEDTLVNVNMIDDERAEKVSRGCC